MKREEAIEIARKLYNDSLFLKKDKEAMATLIPELTESEDEKISREITEFLVDFNNGEYEKPNENTIDSWLAWLEKQKFTQKDVDDAWLKGMCDAKHELEKQGEQKPTNKVETKFKAGNWYQCTKDFFGKGVTFDKNTAYYCVKEGCLQNEYGCHIAIVKDLYDNFKLWDISDAKDGDVLVDEDDNPFIHKGCLDPNHPDSPVAYCGIDHGGYFCNDAYISNRWWTDGKVHPATKEQRDLLFQKMKEAGYKWNVEKKELKKIEQNLAWSEEDEEMFNAVIADIRFTQKVHNHEVNQVVYEREIDWLKSLKDRYTWKPSEEQMRELGVVATGKGFFNKEILRGLLEQLKKLKG